MVEHDGCFHHFLLCFIACSHAHSHTSALVWRSATVAERAATLEYNRYMEIRQNWSIESCRRMKCMRKSGGSPHPNHLSACNKARGHSCTHNPQSSIKQATPTTSSSSLFVSLPRWWRCSSPDWCYALLSFCFPDALIVPDLRTHSRSARHARFKRRPPHTP